MLSAERSFLSREVHSLPRSVRADLQNQSHRREAQQNIQEKKQLEFERKWSGGKVKGKKTNKCIVWSNGVRGEGV